MKSKRKTLKKILLTILCVLLALLLIIGLFCFWWLNDYYHADMTAIEKFATEEIYIDNDSLPDISITREVLDDGSVVYIPSEILGGFIFYPGAKVEHTSYEPLMMACARQGVLCIVVEVPYRVAFFDINAADGIQALYPQVDNWFIGGHSLGGSMAAFYVAEHTEEYEGLILCASYSTVDLSGTDLEILSIYGDQDGVLNMDNLNEATAYISTDDLLYCVIANGNHAFFGMYGPQDGDGEGTVGNIDQIWIAADKIVDTITE